jgi:transcriptional regulator with XRE-family HTH domain
MIKTERIKLGLSQRALGERIGVTQQAVGRWETGQALPDTKTLIQLAQLFHISTDDLLGLPTVTHNRSRQPAKEIHALLINNPGLCKCLLEIKKRPDLQLFFIQISNASPAVVKQLAGILTILNDKEKQA